MYRLRLATTKKKTVENRDKKQEKDNNNGEKKSHVVLYLHSFLVLLVNECVTLLQNNTQYSIRTHRKKDMPSGLVEVADFRSSRTQKRI